MRSSTVSRNDVSATSGPASAEALGGGLYLFGSNVTPGDLIIDSTVAGNTATVSGTPSPDAAGGGIAAYDQRLRVQFATIVRNHLAATSGASPFLGGGGLYLDSDEPGNDRHIEGVVLALNDGVVGPDCDGTGVSDGFNLIGNPAGCTIPPQPTDQNSATPKLGGLTNNGGPTQTIALLTGSPALNKVPKSTCQAIVKKDQRGVARPQGAKCDEGAFEKKP
jgi:hypothetical protein